MTSATYLQSVFLLVQAYALIWITGDWMVAIVAAAVAAIIHVGRAFVGPRPQFLVTAVMAIVISLAIRVTVTALQGIDTFVPSNPYLMRSTLVAVAESLISVECAFVVWGSAKHFAMRIPALLGLVASLCLLASCEPSSNIANATRPLAIVLVLAFALSHGARPSFGGRLRGDHVPRGILAGIVVAIGMTSWSLSDAWADHQARLQRWLDGRVTWVSGYFRAQYGYVRIGQLDSILREQIREPERVAIKVYSQRAPGYLRGRVFERYDKGQWKRHGGGGGKWSRWQDQRNLNPEDVSALPAEVTTTREADSVFGVRPSNGPWSRFEIWNDPDRGEMFFTPLRTSFISGAGSYVSLDEHDIVHSGLAYDEPYTAFVDHRLADRDLRPQLRRRLLARMNGADPAVIQRIAGDTCRGATTAEQKITAVQSYFRDQFTYSIEPVVFPGDTDRLTYFLEQRPPAHCEYFATATVALLRDQGIPARFVTGYVVRELEDEYGDFWLARNKNAHAWAEAYDEQQQRWVTVESTPSMPLPDDGVTVRSRSFDTEEAQDNKLLAMRRSSPLVQWAFRGWSFLRRRVASSEMLGTLIVCGIAWFVLPGIRRWRLRQTEPARALAIESHTLLDKVNSQLRRRGFDRRPAETLHQFARRLTEHQEHDPWLARAADWYIMYAHHRYSETLDLVRLRKSVPAQGHGALFGSVRLRPNRNKAARDGDVPMQSPF